MQAKNRAAFRALMISVSGAALAILAVALPGAQFPAHQVWAFVLAAIILEASPVLINPETKATLSVVALFAAIAAGGLVPAVVIGLATGIVSGFTSKRDRTLKAAFNSGMWVVASAAAAVVFAPVAQVDLMAPLPSAALEEPGWLTLALVVSGLVYSVVNAGLLAGVLHVTSGVPFRQTARDMVGGILGLQSVYVGLAAIAYVLSVKAGEPALILLVVPLVVARRSLLSVQERQEAYDRMVRAFVKAIELKDGYTRGHAERVSDLSVAVAERMGLSYEDRQLIRYGAILHDVGKIGVSLGILCKAGPLDDDEFAEMKTHPEIGAEMLRDIDFLKPALAIVHHHHERVDGRGYPAGLKGGEIPLLTRVVTAVDAFDAMTSTRSYRRALPIEVALEELQANAGTQFDEEVVRHLVALIAEEGWQVTDEPVQVSVAGAVTAEAVVL